jgi:hypothetical protein
MAATKVPYSNPGGNNQTTPGAGGIQTVAAGPTVPGSTVGSSVNPFLPGGATPAGSGMPQPIAAPSVPSGTSDGSLYNTDSHYSSGITDIKKQLVDIYGKGIGGSLDEILKNMGGTDSAIFKQWLASMQPVEASERAGLNSTLGSMGVGPNSSVNAIAQSNLTSQFNAQAAQEDSQLMQTQLQDTIGILTGTEGDASKETASSGWDVFGKVAGAISSLFS